MPFSSRSVVRERETQAVIMLQHVESLLQDLCVFIAKDSILESVFFLICIPNYVSAKMYNFFPRFWTMVCTS